MTSGLKNSIKIKNKLYVKSIKRPTSDNIKQYKQYRNTLHRILRKSERDHYKFLLNINKNNLIKQWSIIKDVINRKRSSNIVTDGFLIDQEVIKDNKVIAEKFNEFYVNIGPNLSKSLPVRKKDPLSYLPPVNPHSMFLNPVDRHEVTNVILLIKNSSSGSDNISAKIVKCSIDIYLDTLTHIINLSLPQGVFPSQLKTAKVIPLYKSNDKQLIKNYRPVSLLLVFSKIFERIVYNRLYSFIQKYQLLYKYQFGFQKNYGTNTALIVLIDKIMNSLNNGENVLGLLLDFSKAFDCVNHDILIRKMCNYGIRGVCLDWFKNYLSDRKQYVLYNGVKSSERIISCGVPQGSILGPLLFLIYINDLANVSEKLFTILYADDSNLFITGKDIDALISTLNDEMPKFIQWLNVNKLCLNIDKTQYMVFSLRMPIFSNLEVIISDQKI